MFPIFHLFPILIISPSFLSFPFLLFHFSLSHIIISFISALSLPLPFFLILFIFLCLWKILFFAFFLLFILLHNTHCITYYPVFQTAESHYTRKKHTTTTPPKQLQKLMDERNAQPLPPPTPFPKPPRKFLTEEDRWAFICENITDESRARWYGVIAQCQFYCLLV